MILLGGRVPLFEHDDWLPLARVMGHPMRLPVNEVIAHHSYIPDVACGETVAREVEALHGMDVYHTVEKVWGGFAYGYAIFQSGHVYVGRGPDRTGAHTKGRNSTSQSVCFVTDGSVSALTAAARAAFHALVQHLILARALSPAYTLSPHDRYAQKVCPGLKIKAQLPTLVRAVVRDWPTLRVGDRGTAVAYLQDYLSQVGLLLPDGYVAGHFGAATFMAVQQFQRDNSLVADAVVGRKTWALIP